MPVLNLSAQHLLSIFQKLMPRGAIWPREAEANQSRALGTLMPTYKRLLERDNNLLVDAFPATTLELLDEWEATLGLPDPCAGEGATVQARVRQVVAQLTATGGQSRGYFIGVAAALGYTVTITEFAPARADALLADEPVYDEPWAHAWRINAPAVTTVEFQADQSFADEPLATWGNDVLECTLNRLKPAHTVLLFGYGS